MALRFIDFTPYEESKKRKSWSKPSHKYQVVCPVAPGEFLNQFYLISKNDLIYNLNGCCNLSAKAAGQWGLMSNNASASLSDRLKNSLPVPRQDRDDVDDLARDAKFLLRELSNFTQNMDLRSPADKGDIITWDKRAQKLK